MADLVLFDITQFSKMQMFLPVIRRLEACYGIRSMVLSNSEINPSQPTNVRALRDWDVDFVQAAPFRISARFKNLDWYLYMVWVRRNAARLLQHCNARVVVTPNDRTYPHHFYIDAANELGIPSLLMQEALRKDELFEMRAAEKIRRRLEKLVFGIDSRLKKYGQGGCAKIAAWGETSRAYFARVGVPAERIVITGNPALDEIQTRDWQTEAKNIDEQIGTSPHDVFIVFLTSRVGKQGFMGESEFAARIRWFFGEFCAVCRQLPGVSLQLVVRVKPENVAEQAFYRELIQSQETSQFCRMPEKDVPLYPLLYRSDAAVMFSTTAGLEAALFGKPVGMIDVGARLDNWNFAEEGVATRIASRAEMEHFVRSILSPDERERLGQAARANASKYVAHLGSATDNVAELIHQLYQATKPQ